MSGAFKKLVRRLSAEKHPPSDPKAVAAVIGVKKYGKAEMQAKAAAGKKKC